MSILHVNGASLNYRLEGDTGPVVLLSNSLASTLAMWAPQVPALLAVGYRVLRYDTRGHGASSVPPGPYTIDQLATDALSLIDALGVEKVHFCGLSLGGMTGQRFATLHGNRLHSLTLCATAAWMGPPDLWDSRIQQVLTHGMGSVVEATLQRWFTPAGLARMEAELRPIREGILHTPPAGYAACGAAIRDMDQRESIRAITTPTLIIGGELDPGTTVEHARQLHTAIEGSELLIIPESQHLLNLEAAGEFNPGLLSFLQRHG
ncbi:MAG: 3-oxoadipate enol-lactonase [Gammaproteobacteria bacterium]|nr:3-oxoadipate enol-lactonase [Gammaproteobacteria bacterium]